MKKEPEYRGFEQGPIRPPSEAHSLLIRITRNCPWNRCSFCPVYKGTKFSLRPVEHVKRDIDAVHAHVVRIREAAENDGPAAAADWRRLGMADENQDPAAFQAALHWALGGMESVFLQDANSLILPPRDLEEILRHLKDRFPWVQRITSYARSHTIARISESDMAALADAGLNRIHIGLESGCNAVLKQVRKGVDRETHIRAGRRVKAAGIELSEYVMPGLGGRALSAAHADDTADALNRIDPDFIRLRTLAVPNRSQLAEQLASGEFEKLTDLETAGEIRRFLAGLEGITSRIVSDHILNLFEEINGRLPEDKPRMLAALDHFLALAPDQQMLYQIGRRLGVFSGLDDMASPQRMSRAEQACQRYGITPENVDGAIDELMKRFI